jgi:uncharacterized membrane protein YfcA
VSNAYEKRTGRVTEIVIAVSALGVFGAFLGIIVWKVPQTPLIVIFSLIFLMAAFDFWNQLRGNRKSTTPNEKPDSES